MSASGQRSHIFRKTRSAPRTLTRKSCTSATLRRSLTPPGPTRSVYAERRTARIQQSGQARAFAAGVTAKQHSSSRPGGEGQPLGEIVEQQRPAAEAASDHLTAPGGEQGEGLAAESAGGRMAAGVAKPHVGLELRGHGPLPRSQTQVHVLVEEELTGIEGPELPQQLRSGGEAGRDRPADLARPLG